MCPIVEPKDQVRRRRTASRTRQPASCFPPDAGLCGAQSRAEAGNLRLTRSARSRRRYSRSVQAVNVAVLLRCARSGLSCHDAMRLRGAVAGPWRAGRGWRWIFPSKRRCIEGLGIVCQTICMMAAPYFKQPESDRYKILRSDGNDAQVTGILIGDTQLAKEFPATCSGCVVRQ